MSQVHLELQKSEAVVAQCAATIYAAYITSGQVEAGKESEWISRSIREAAEIAYFTDQAIQSDDERLKRDHSDYK